MHTGSAQCMHALATINLPLDGPCRRKRGLLSCVDAQARTQSSQRVQRSRSITIVAVPLKKRFAVRNSSVSPGMVRCAKEGGWGSTELAPPLLGKSFLESVGKTSCSITRVGTTNKCV